MASELDYTLNKSELEKLEKWCEDGREQKAALKYVGKVIGWCARVCCSPCFEMLPW